MKTVIICNGEITDYSYSTKVIQSADYVICADGGTRHTYAMGIDPDIIIGDFDSSSSEYLEYYKNKGIKVEKHPIEKDKTDSHICILKALDFSDEIVILGATGNRLDHTLANISLLKIGIDRGVKMYIADKQNEIFLIDREITISGKPGEYFSVIPFTPRVEGICINGAKYELNDAVMEFGDPYGTSNEFKEKKVHISIKSGYLLVIKSRD
ncbi:thiamine diphosphokinase [Lutispora thermophila]|uniref:Thiamine diphosphokinase n=1 Tax=Lutispora thermophila DSM 19022 TaxID=1122184 RepID=A0A1M6G3K0_9FIRM|nr:thiamine diphosphokinase [Lutispora thermophila]SHJ04529.1 thiamine diphosphokinase [Lutispora thermophila DSM 19022]